MRTAGHSIFNSSLELFFFPFGQFDQITMRKFGLDFILKYQEKSVLD